MTFPLAVRRSTCHHSRLVNGRMMAHGWMNTSNVPLFGLPWGSNSLPTELPGLVTPSRLNSDEVAVCRSCWQPMIWDHEYGWTIWGPLEPLDGQRRGVPQVAIRGPSKVSRPLSVEDVVTGLEEDVGTSADPATWVQLYGEFKKEKRIRIRLYR